MSIHEAKLQASRFKTYAMIKTILALKVTTVAALAVAAFALGLPVVIVANGGLTVTFTVSNTAGFASMITSIVAMVRWMR